MRNVGHFIKEWREARGLSLRKLADRLLTDTFEPIISYASLSRIEKGTQPYSQETLEAIATALGTTPAGLLIFDPSKDEGFLTIWDRLPRNKRETSMSVFQAMAKTGTDG